jgi:hypothetical protein
MPDHKILQIRGNGRKFGNAFSNPEGETTGLSSETLERLVALVLLFHCRCKLL